jgi:hypothetical protein
VESGDQEETTAISTKDFTSLLDDAEFLQCLREAGVDNWSGYDYANELYRDIQKDN